MSRHSLLRGVSACALTLFALSEFYATPAAAQQSLPTIDVGGQRRGVRRGADRVAGPATTTMARDDKRTKASRPGLMAPGWRAGNAPADCHPSGPGDPPTPESSPP